MTDLRPEVRKLLDAERDGRIEIEDGEIFEVRDGGMTTDQQREFCAAHGHIFQEGDPYCTICGAKFR